MEMIIKIFCIGCNDHEFKVDTDLFKSNSGIKLECPDCNRTTAITADAGGMIISELKPLNRE